jgi:ERCC4-related helicase
MRRSTHIQAHVAAHELTLKHAADDPDKLTKALVDAQVDLNPHQVDAALFAFQNPLSKGALLADEVGLGKTIEAGLIATQYWAERRRRVLVLCPASLRTQWRDELQEKFFLPSVILDSKVLKESHASNPFDEGHSATPRVVIASYHFAARQQDRLMTVPWDLAILDEAHRLRNVYKGARIAESIRAALATTPKVLLTATPLQNSLLELYGLVSFIDDDAFGDVKTFSRKYARASEEGDRFDELKARLEPLCHRTLRRQVVEYVSYTKREPITQEFWPTDDEQRVYDLVSEYLRRDELLALPNAQRNLITLVLRKLLASSTFAIAGALDTMVRRLEKVRRDGEKVLAEQGMLDADDLASDLIVEELDGAIDRDELRDDLETEGAQPQILSAAQMEAVGREAEELARYRDLAQDITENAKGDALLAALRTAFERAGKLGAERKAVVFTESRRTQEYLMGLLSHNGYDGKVIRFSGTNNDPVARQVYAEWRKAHAGSDRVTGSRAVDVRAALVDAFRREGEIMIATEAAAEGINLQFCSIVVNYDLPWNPQRVEQRIGRCHRYGQRNDVLVVNFLNQANAADQRVYQLLAEKFRLFEGVFGASDEVLGSIESGVDIERRIGEIYQRCRTQEEIDADFEQLQLEFSDVIDSRMAETRTKLLEHFDAQVHDRLKVRLDASRAAIDRHQERLLEVMRFALGDEADFDPGSGLLTVNDLPPEIDGPLPRRYSINRPGPDDPVHYLRPTDALATWALERALVPPAAGCIVHFDYSGWSVTSAELADLVSREGTLRATKLTIAGKDDEEHLLLVAATDTGDRLTDAQVQRLLQVPAHEETTGTIAAPQAVTDQLEQQEEALLSDFTARRAEWLGAEYEKLDRWAQDERDRLRADVTDLERKLKECARGIRQAGTEPDRLPLRRQKLQLERQLHAARSDYDAAAAQVDRRQEAMLDQIEHALSSEHTSQTLFTIRWKLT